MAGVLFKDGGVLFILHQNRKLYHDYLKDNVCSFTFALSIFEKVYKDIK